MRAVVLRRDADGCVRDERRGLIGDPEDDSFSEFLSDLEMDRTCGGAGQTYTQAPTWTTHSDVVIVRQAGGLDI